MAKTAWCNIPASCSIDRMGGASTGLVYDLTDSVDSARALAPRDVATAPGLIAHGEHKISLELICAQVDEHDSLPTCEELEALRKRGAG